MNKKNYFNITPSQFYISIFTLITTTSTLAKNHLADPIQAIQNEILQNGTCYSDLQELTQTIGPRLSGSVLADKSVEWTHSKLASYQLDKVFKVPTKVPHWTRGTHESASIQVDGVTTPLAVAALGNSAGTSGIEAQVVEVQSLDQAQRLGSSLSGKIVFYNRPMDPNLEDTFAAYGRAVDQRSSGPATAAKFNAAAVLVRSMTTLVDDDHPHTGVTTFRSASSAIPAAALSTHAANILSAQLKKNPNLKLRLLLSAKTLPDVLSNNVVGEVTGKDSPNEIVLVGGHLDSWDLGQGAHDDGTGVVQSLDVCRAIKKLGFQPKRTIRCVAFMSEEFGGIGAQDYARYAKSHGESYVMAVESDRGGFSPEKFSVSGSNDDIQNLNAWIPYFNNLGIKSFEAGGGGTDVDPLASLGAITMDLVPQSKHYFDYHHADTDRFETVNEMELKKGAASLATLVWLFANQD